MNTSFVQGPLDQAYIDPVELQYSCNDDNNLLDIDNCYLETTHSSGPLTSSSNRSDTTISSTNSMVRCEQYAMHRHYRLINSSREFCEPRTSPIQNARNYSYEHEELNPTDYEQETMDLPDSCLLFPTYNSIDDIKHTPGKSTMHNAVSKSTPNENLIAKKPSRLNRPTVNCCTNVKKLVSKFTKKLRSTKIVSKPTKNETIPQKKLPVQQSNKKQPNHLRPPHQVHNYQHHHKHKQVRYQCPSINQRPIETPRRKADKILYLPKSQPSQFSSHNYDFDNIFESNNNQFKTLGDIVTYFI
jgi:hypothetical protein